MMAEAAKMQWDIAIRADGGGTIGMGHIVRCCSIALALREAGASVGFVCADSSALRYIESRGFDVEVLGTAPDALEDAQAELEALAAHAARLVVVDSLFATPHYLDQLGGLVAVCQITPSLETAPHADILVNYGGYKGEAYYAPAGIDGKTRLFGMSYAPLGRDYWDMKRRPLSQEVEHVLLTCGGTDPVGAVPFALEAVDESGAFGGAVKDVVVGRYARYSDALLDAWRGRPDVVVHLAPDSLLELERICDLAVCAAGTTIYELLAFGVPTMCFAMVDNQLQVAALDGVVSWCGDIRGQEAVGLDPSAKERIARKAAKFADLGARQRLASASEDMIDFGGARRLAAALLDAIEPGKTR